MEQSWQEAEIYRVVVDAGLNGLTLDQITSGVQKAYFADGETRGVTAGTAKEEAVRRGLLGLIAKQAIVRDTAGRYLAPALQQDYLIQGLNFARAYELSERAFMLVMEYRGNYSAKELRDKLVSEGASSMDAWRAVMGNVFSNPPAFVPSNEKEKYGPDVKLKVLE